MGKDKIALGSDYPFPLGELDPGTLIRTSDFSKNTQESLLNKSALSWLGMATYGLLGTFEIESATLYHPLFVLIPLVMALSLY